MLIADMSRKLQTQILLVWILDCCSFLSLSFVLVPILTSVLVVVSICGDHWQNQLSARSMYKHHVDGRALTMSVAPHDPMTVLVFQVPCHQVIIQIDSAFVYDFMRNGTPPDDAVYNSYSSYSIERNWFQ